MRPPSLYSQDDPISEALKPPSTETESERIARMSAEDEAKRISEQIDEDLREERERLRRKKGDVKVCILLLFLLAAYTHLFRSCSFSAKQRVASRPSRSSFSSCTGRILLTTNASHGRLLYTSTSYIPSNTS
jgi:hypothetical protein